MSASACQAATSPPNQEKEVFYPAK